MHDIDKLILEHTEYITGLYRDIETRVIYSIIEMINKHGRITGTAELSLQKLYDMNALDYEVLQEIASITGYPLQELEKSVEIVTKGAIDYETLNKAYDKGLILTNPESVVLQGIINDTLKYIGGDMKQVRTTVEQYVIKDFKRTVDKYLIETELGTMTENEAVIETVKELASKGITSATYKRTNKDGTQSTVQMGLEPYMRRMIRTEFVKTSAEANIEVGEQLDTKHYYVSQHVGARDKGIGYENHESWQNGVYTKEELTTVCGYGEMLGLSGINCRHIMFPYVKGISVPIPPKIDTEENNRVYELQQLQRKYERDIRATKREINALELLDLEDKNNALQASKQRLKRQQARVRQLVKDNQDVLRRDYAREKVVTI